MSPPKYILALAVLVGAMLLFGSSSSMAQPVEQQPTPASITCDQLVQLAETSVGQVCDGLGRNKACYGNHLISAQFQPNSNVVFQKSGDTVDLLNIKKLSTAPLNVLTKDWGIAVIKAQANLPDSLPGQNVTFLLYGDTTMDNPSPDMHAVTVSTRIGNTNCTSVPDSAVLIQSPSGSQVAMNINGADVTLGSTAYITAQQNQGMAFAIVEGEGVITANGVRQIVQPGAQVMVPMGGADGLEASGPPSQPQPFDLQAIQLAPLQLLDRPVTVPLPIQGGQGQVQQPTSIPPTQQVACTPRTDWTYRYVVQRGDYLANIAQKLNMRTEDLQAGNCIVNPNQLIVGQTLRVPFPVATNVPPQPTFTPTPASVEIIGPNLRADKTEISPGDCVNIYWDVDNISQVYFENQPEIGHSSQQECPGETTTYTLVVVTKDNRQVPYEIVITVDEIIY